MKQSKTKHTPGPWKFVRSIDPESRSINMPASEVNLIFSPTTDCIVDCVKHRADAALIAAAPEMLEALEHALKILSHADVIEQTRKFVAPKYGENVVNEIEALINKAKGGSNE